MRSVPYACKFRTHALVCLVLGSSSAWSGISLPFDQASPYVSSTGADTLKGLGDVVPGAGTVDLGQSGMLYLDGYQQPRGAFSVELRVKLKAYGPLSTRYISDFVNTATWGTTTPQGFTVRAGGGELYPVLARGAYSDSSVWASGASYFGHTESASISRCLGEFGIGTGGADWKEVYSDRCLDLGKWLHIVATYDGEEMRYFVDGHDATDGWRVVLPDAKPVIDSIARLNIGARDAESWDSRHAYGEIDFVTIHDSALSSVQIRSRYRKTLSLPKQDSIVPTCRRALKMLDLQAGEAVSSASKLHLRIEASPECEDTTFAPDLSAKDSIEIEVASTPDFSDSRHKSIHDTSVALGSVIQDLPSGEVFVRCRVRSGTDSLKSAARAAATGNAVPWEASKPLVVSQVTGIHDGGRHLSTRWNGRVLRVSSLDAPKVTDLAGHVQAWDAHRSGDAWNLMPSLRAHGTYLVVAPGAASTIVLP